MNAVEAGGDPVPVEAPKGPPRQIGPPVGVTAPVAIRRGSEAATGGRIGGPAPVVAKPARHHGRSCRGPADG